MASFYNRYYRYYRPYFPNPYLTSRDRVSPCHKDVKEHEKTSSYSENDEDFSRSKKDDNSSRGFSFGPVSFKNPLFSDLESPVFEVFGIQLYLDDIIILGLLFFLYNEGVQDEMLYIALIMLLIG